MSHLYPIAENAEEALNNAEQAALTRYDAEALFADREIVCLETEWLAPDTANVLEVIDAAEAGPGHGFVQRYEDEKGAPVLAVTYWKLGGARTQKTPKPPVAPAKSDEDHTDDLYFREGRTKPARKRGRKKFIDPRQLDMFGGNTDPED